MSYENQDAWLPANHRKPTADELQAQISREEEASALGKIKAERKLRQQKDTMDYSRSQAGSVLLDKSIALLSDLVEFKFDESTKRIGNACGLIGPIVKELKHTPLINIPKFKDGEVVKDADGNQVMAFTTERHTCLWDSDDIAFITLLTMLDVAQMPLLSKVDESKYLGKRRGSRPDIYGLEHLIAGRLQDHFCHKYIRACTRGTGQDYLMDMILRSYTPNAGARQKQQVTRRARKQEALEFIAHGASPVADVLQWKPWPANAGKAIAAKSIALAELALEEMIGFRVFEQIDKYESSFYAFTDEAQDWAEKVDAARIGKSFSTDVMICPPRPHTPDQAGGYVGVAKSLIPVTAPGGFKGEFKPSDQHLRLLNAAQNIPYRINNQILEVMEAMHKLPHQDWRQVEHFVPTPSYDHFVKTPPLGPIPKGMTPEQKAKRDKQRDDRKKEFAKYRSVKDDSETSYTEETLELARRCRDLKSFWVPHTLCFRGRAYSQNYLLNPQGMSYQRALIQFGNGVPVDSRTKYFLELGIANTGGQDKQSFEARIAWFQQHKAEILDSIKDMDSILDPNSFWRTYEGMDDSWAFLALALEWKRLYVDNDTYRSTHAIVHLDATCSGGQLQAALLHSRVTAAAVNLLPGAEGVFDIYRRCLEFMQQRIKELGYGRVPLRDCAGQELIDGEGNTLYITERRARYLFSTKKEVRDILRKACKKGFLPKMYGAGSEKSRAAFKKAFKFIGWTGKKEKLSHAEARALSPIFEEAVAEVMPALGSFMDWCRAAAQDALQVEDKEARRKDGKPYAEPQFKPRLDEDGNPILELIVPTPNGSEIVLRYRKRDRKSIRVDHLTTYSKLTPSKKHRQEIIQVAKNEVDYKAMGRALPPNLIHAADACLLSFLVDSFKGDQSFSIIHDSIGMAPSAQMDDLLPQFREALIKSTPDSYLNGFLEANGLDEVDHPIPNFRSFDATECREAKYPLC